MSVAFSNLELTLRKDAKAAGGGKPKKASSLTQSETQAKEAEIAAIDEKVALAHPRSARQRALGAALGAGRGWARDWRRSGSTCRCCGWTARWRRRSCHVCKGWMSPRRCRHNLQSRAGRGRSARARRRPGAPPDA